MSFNHQDDDELRTPWRVLGQIDYARVPLRIRRACLAMMSPAECEALARHVFENPFVGWNTFAKLVVLLMYEAMDEASTKRHIRLISREMGGESRIADTIEGVLELSRERRRQMRELREVLW